MQKFSFGLCGRCVEEDIMLVAILLIAASFSESHCLMAMIVYVCVFVYTNTDRHACSGGGFKGEEVLLEQI